MAIGPRLGRHITLATIYGIEAMASSECLDEEASSKRRNNVRATSKTQAKIPVDCTSVENDAASTAKRHPSVSKANRTIQGVKQSEDNGQAVDVLE